MNAVTWRGAMGRWTKWHYERDEYPYSLYCRATVAEKTITLRQKVDLEVGAGPKPEEICRECTKNLYWEVIKSGAH
jgi:hypothetical protein